MARGRDVGRACAFLGPGRFLPGEPRQCAREPFGYGLEWHCQCQPELATVEAEKDESSPIALHVHCRARASDGGARESDLVEPALPRTDRRPSSGLCLQVGATPDHPGAEPTTR